MTDQDPTSKKPDQDEEDVNAFDLLDKSLLDESVVEFLGGRKGLEEPEQETEAVPTVESLQADLAKMKDQWMRAVAETENMRRRSVKDREDANKYAVTSFARNLLSVSDNLSRALESVATVEDLPESVKALVSGVEMTQNELNSIFERASITSVSPLNEKFDPHLHQAMFELENNEVDPGTVLQVLQTGYVIHDRLLRPALVAVSKKSV